jgi:hypothetical protein
MKTTIGWLGILACTTLVALATADCNAQASKRAPSTGAVPAAKAGDPASQAEAGTSTAANHDKKSTDGPDDDNGPDYDKIEAEREKIWTSPEMLSARAWLETYFERSAKISDEQAKKYMDELKTMFPDQMQIWLMKFQADRESRKQQTTSERQARQTSISMRQASPQVGGFRNPYANRRAVSSGQPIGNVRQNFGGGANPVAQRQPVQKPFSGPEYQNVRRPLVTSEDVARWEILRGLGWGRPY